MVIDWALATAANIACIKTNNPIDRFIFPPDFSWVQQVSDESIRNGGGE
jgi:hypothetical protein